MHMMILNLCLITNTCGFQTYLRTLLFEILVLVSGIFVVDKHKTGKC